MAVTVILVVENDPHVCDLVVEILKSELAADVQCARTASLGLEAIETAAFDLAIINAGMPEIPGLELANRALAKGVPPLLYTGHPDRLAQLQDCDCPHLAKPFKVEDLIDGVAKIITGMPESLKRIETSLTHLQASGGHSVRDTHAAKASSRM